MGLHWASLLTVSMVNIAKYLLLCGKNRKKLGMIILKYWKKRMMICNSKKKKKKKKRRIKRNVQHKSLDHVNVFQDDKIDIILLTKMEVTIYVLLAGPRPEARRVYFTGTVSKPWESLQVPIWNTKEKIWKVLISNVHISIYTIYIPLSFCLSIPIYWQITKDISSWVCVHPEM